MAQTLSTQTAHAQGDQRVASPLPQSLESFLSELRRMTPDERIRASRHTMSRHERSIYAARYPDEVPLLNGELEWIARDCV
jgi:hypothetical protein